MDKLKRTVSFALDVDEIDSLDGSEIYRANDGVQYRNPSRVAPAQRRDRFTGALEDFSRLLSADAWCFAQTEPGVVGVQRSTNAFTDVSADLPKERSFEFRLRFDNQPDSFWVTVPPTLLKNHRRLDIYRTEATRQGIALRFITHDDLYRDAVEYTNRLRAHAYLCDCASDASRDLTSRMLEHVTPAYRSVETIAKSANARWPDALVACLVLWVRGQLRADPVSYVGPKWLVRA